MRPRVQWIIRRDMPELMAIERAQGDNWNEERWLNYLRRRDCIGRSLVIGDIVFGGMLYLLESDALILRRIIVSANMRRQGLGTMMIEKLKENHRKRLRCLVPESNVIMQLFLRKNGFRATHIFQNRIAFSWEVETSGGQAWSTSDAKTAG